MVVHTPPVYLDHQAGTPLHPEVAEAMREALADFGDPEALHDWGRAPAAAIDHAREAVATLIGATPERIIFTAGEVEARNLAVKGTISARHHDGHHIIASPMEHPATLSACRSTTRHDGTLTLLPVDALGNIAPTDLHEALRDDTVLLCLTHGQAEIGTIADIPGLTTALSAVPSRPTIHVDATLTAGLLDLDLPTWNSDLVSIGAGPLGGPRWAGALWIGPDTRLHPLIEGGAQEAGKRGGPVNVPAIVGFGVAAARAVRERATQVTQLRALTERLATGLLQIDGVRLNGPPLGSRLPGHLQVSVDGADSEALTLMLAVRNVAVSPGSACTGAGKSSPVLEALGLEARWAHSAVLFTLAPTTTVDEIDHAITRFADAVRALRDIGVPS